MKQKRLRVKPQISIRIPEPLLAKLDEHIELTALSQTDIVIAAIAEYLDTNGYLDVQECLTVKHRLRLLESKYEELEGKIDDLQRQLHD